MALAAALMHETILAANPVTVLLAVFRMGWAYLVPCLVTRWRAAGRPGSLWPAFPHVPNVDGSRRPLEFWVFVFYEGMVVMRMLGLTYHAHALDLLWFRRRPRWASTRLHGRIYANS